MMKTLILNGSPDGGLDAYVEALASALRTREHSVSELRLRDLELHGCTGCFGCWVRTPGACVQDDGGRDLDRQIMAADLVIFASPILMGHVSALLRRAGERMLPLIQPYARLVDGESRHVPRYAGRPRLALLLARTSDCDDEDVEIIRRTYQMTARNFATELAFTLTTSLPAEEVAHEAAAA
jgi:multimeric flavodoxin WrbA